MLKILVDGYNVMHKMKSVNSLLKNSLEEARETFIEIIRRFLQHSGQSVRVVVVFDGKSDHAHSSGFTRENGKIQVMFSRHPETADTLLVQLMDEERTPHHLLVVSSDQDILYSAKCRSIKTHTSEQFIEKLHGKPRRHTKETPHLTKGELDYWLKVFKQE